MEWFNKVKNKLGMLALFGLLFQLSMPVYETYVFANENGIGVTKQQADQEKDNLEEDEGNIELEDGQADDTQEEKGQDNEELKEEKPVEDGDGQDDIDQNADEQAQDLVGQDQKDLGGERKGEAFNTQKNSYSTILEKQGKQSIENYFEVTQNSNILSKGNLTFYNEEVETPTPTISSIAQVYFNWAIPPAVAKQVKEGDFFEFQLPAELKLTGTITGNLGVFGSFVATPSGKVTMTFNNQVNELPNAVKGHIEFQSRLDESKIKETGIIEIDLPVKEDATKEVFIKPDYKGKEIEKKGEIDSVLNPKSVEWTVDFNKGLNTLEEVKITENFPEGNEYESVKVYKLKISPKGNVIGTGLEEEVTSGFTVVGNGNVTFTGEISDAYRLVYQTNILDKIKEDEGNTVELKNNVTLGSEGTALIQAEAEVTANFGKIINKDRKEYDSKKQTFTWTARYNYGIKDIKKENAKLTDVMDSRLEIIEESIKLEKVTPTAEKKEKDPKDLVEGTDYKVVPTTNGFKIEFLTDVNYAVKMTYDTKVKDGEYIDGNADKVTNTITVDGGPTAGSGGTLIQQGVIKSGATIDYTAQTIQWNITVNRNQYEMKNVTLSDTFDNKGLTLEDKDKFIITDTSKKEPLEQGIDYELKLKPDKGGFDIEFIGDYVTTSSTFKISYETPYVFNDLKTKTSIFKNTATLNWKDSEGKQHTNENSDQVDPNKETKSNGFKNGSYNSIDKKISWTVGVNYNGEEIQKGALISDPITGNQVYRPGSAKLYEYTVNADGNIMKKDVKITPASITEPTELENILTVELPDSAVGTTKAYLLEFETRLKGQVIEDETTYTNIATFENGTNPDRTLEGKVSISYSGELLNKNGKQRASDGSFVDWSIYINRSQSTVKDVVIVDKPSPNQILVTGSLEIYPLEVQENGKFKTGENPLKEGKDLDYTLDLKTDNLTGQQTITVEFSNEIDQAYLMEYSTLLSLGTDDKSVSNKMTFSGNNKEVVEDKREKIVQVESSSGSGSGSGEKGTITFSKTGSNGNLMEGVKFELWNKDKTQVIRTGEIDDEGLLTFGSLIYGEYYLKEIATLPGYTVSDQLATGKKVEVNKETSKSEKDIDVELTNDLSKVIINKTNEAGTGLDGAEFKVSKKIDTEEYEVVDEYESVKTDDNGKIILEGLLPGEYRLEETKAPAGYILNTNLIDFEVTNKGIQVPTVKVDVTNYKGSAQLVKSDKDENGLTGAEFSVFSASATDDEPLHTGLVSNAEGIVTVSGLAPGTYYFKETKAADGYILNKEKVKFTIEKEAEGKPMLVDKGKFINYQGSVELRKFAADGKTLLSDAVFQLTGDDDTGYVVNEFTTEDGMIRVDNLKPGDYQFKEITAPEGFVLNQTPIKFTVEATQIGEPELLEISVNNYKGSAQLTKTNNYGTPLRGAQFSVLDEDGEVVETAGIEYEEGGLVKVTNLSPGKYSFSETRAPGGYIRNTTIIPFEIASESTNTDGNGKPGKPDVVDTGEFKNYKGSVRFTKTDKEGNPIEGAEFSLINSSGRAIRTELKSNANGIISATGLDSGSYTFKETKAAEGYVINDREIEFTIGSSAQGQPATVRKGEFKNYKGSAQLIKTDEDGDPLAGAEFTVLDKDGAVVQNDLVSDEKGIVRIGDLAPGTYSFKETKAPTGYILNSKEIDFTILAEETDEPEIVSVGEFTNYQGTVEFSKIDKEGNLLSDAVFELTGDESTGYDTTEFTVENGKIIISNLKPGKYEFKEVRAPKGYILNTTSIPFEIKAEETGEPEIVILSTVNYQGSVTLIKVDSKQERKVLAGAEFNLIDKNGNILHLGLRTDEKGRIDLSGLLPGEYSFVETKAPKGYALSREPIVFTIDSKYEGQPADIILKVKNAELRPGDVEDAEKPDDPTGTDKPGKPGRPGEVEGSERPQGPQDGVEGYYTADGVWLPKTGETSNFGLYLAGGLLVLAGIVLGRKRIEE